MTNILPTEGKKNPFGFGLLKFRFPAFTEGKKKPFGLGMLKVCDLLPTPNLRIESVFKQALSNGKYL